MSYTIHVQSKDGVSFFVDNLPLEAAKVLELATVLPITKLDSTLKNRDIILSTKVHLVKAMVFQ